MSYFVGNKLRFELFRFYATGRGEQFNLKCHFDYVIPPCPFLDKEPETQQNGLIRRFRRLTCTNLLIGTDAPSLLRVINYGRARQPR